MIRKVRSLTLKMQAEGYRKLFRQDSCNTVYPRNMAHFRYIRGVLISPYPDQEGNKLQRPNSGFIQHTPHEAQYSS